MKQVLCGKCGSPYLHENGAVFICRQCGCKYMYEDVITTAYGESLYNTAFEGYAYITKEAPNMLVGKGWGKFLTICMIIFCIFPFTGAMISGSSLLNAKLRQAANINVPVAITTLAINVIITIAGAVALGAIMR